jgi:peptidyl-prolyl cis-trans isomerase B (cyclophilin B)
MKRALFGIVTGVALTSLLLTAGLCADEGKKEEENMQEVAVIETRFGEIVLEFFPDVAPGHVANFKKLASEGFYDGCTFHRVIPGFVIQGGDPNSKDDDRSNDGMGGPGYTIDAEFNSRKHERGTLSMARGMDPNSAGSQFFICVKKQPALDGKYTVFGRVIEGMDVVDKIVSVKRDAKDNPVEPVPMEKVTIEKRPVK